MRIAKSIVEVVLILAVAAVYLLRSFHPEQPLHHQFNEAGGVLLIALLLVLLLFPTGDDK